MSENEDSSGCLTWIVVVIAAIMAFTCPKKRAHVDAIREKVASASISAIAQNNEYGLLGLLLAANEDIGKAIEVKNWYFFSYSDFFFGYSVGIFGKVFVFFKG